MRLSLGATRGRCITQVLTESVLLAVLGGIASLVVAYWTLNGIIALLPTDVAPRCDFSSERAGLRVRRGVFAGHRTALRARSGAHSTRPDLVTALRDNSGKLSATAARRASARRSSPRRSRSRWRCSFRQDSSSRVSQHRAASISGSTSRTW